MARHGTQPLPSVLAALLVVLGGLLIPALPAAAAPGDALWLGNDTVGSVFETTTTGSVLTQVPATPVTGVAFDGTFLYFSNSAGTISKRAPDGTTVLDTFGVPPVGSPTEDLAWDSTRGRLWRIEHNPPTLRRIDPVTEAADATFPLSAADPELAPLGGLGIAYDSARDLLYVSFCQAGCATLLKGLVKVFDPATGAELGELFRTDGFAAGGLAYDRATDTLWVGDTTVVRNMSLAGAVLSSFTRPAPGGFVDGLEFIGQALCDPFADAVTAFSPGPGVGPGFDNPATALGAPDGTPGGVDESVSLGTAGSIVLQFTNNFLVDGPGNDLTVYEDPGTLEGALVEVSADGVTFVSLGTATGTTSFDLAGSGLAWARYVRVTDPGSNPTGFPFAGYDLDAVRAIQSRCAVSIDIKPGSFPNSIKLSNQGVVPVAILSTESFDATTVDPASVCFGDAEDPAQRDCSEAHGTGHIEDVNGDGRLDLVLHYETSETDIDLGDTEACLTGQTFGGDPVQGCDSVRTR